MAKRKKPKTASLKYEIEQWNHPDRPHHVIVGMDEVGRGAWAGPVVVGAVCLGEPTDELLELMEGVRDSKAMTSRQRAERVEIIQEIAVSYGIGSASHQEIDRIGIVPATKLAMQRALDALLEQAPRLEVDCILTDSIRWETAPCTQVNIKFGDRESLTIAAASVLAKEYRDQHMRDIDAQYPAYSFSNHKGYGTLKHRQALKTAGISEIHRRSFNPMKTMLLQPPLDLDVP